MVVGSLCTVKAGKDGKLVAAILVSLLSVFLLFRANVQLTSLLPLQVSQWMILVASVMLGLFMSRQQSFWCSQSFYSLLL